MLSSPSGRSSQASSFGSQPPLSLLLVGFGAACVVVRCVCFWVNFCVGCTAVGTGAGVVVCCVVVALVVVVVVVCSVVVAVSLVVVVVALVVVVVCEVVVVSVSVSELLSAADDEPLSLSESPETAIIIITAAIISAAAIIAIMILPFLDIKNTPEISFFTLYNIILLLSNRCKAYKKAPDLRSSAVLYGGKGT